MAEMHDHPTILDLLGTSNCVQNKQPSRCSAAWHRVPTSVVDTSPIYNSTDEDHKPPRKHAALLLPVPKLTMHISVAAAAATVLPAAAGA